MSQYDQQDQQKQVPLTNPLLFDIEPVRNFEQNCLDDVVASIARWAGRHHELMYIDALSFTFTPETVGKNEEVSSRLYVKDRLDRETLERFHGLRSIIHDITSSIDALAFIQDTLEAGTPVVVAINSFWVPWDDQYQQAERRHLCIVVGHNPQTRDLYCTDPYFTQKGMLLPASHFHKGYLYYLTIHLVHEEVSSFSPIADAMIECLQRETAGNRPFIQMRELANTFTTSFQGAQETGRYTQFSEVPLFLKITDIADARTKYSQLLNYLGNTYDARFLSYEERIKKISNQWGLVRNMLMKMYFASKWTDTALQKVSLRILNISVEEQTLVYELLALLRTYSSINTTNGDRDESLELDEDYDALDDEDEYTAPRTPLETQLATCWKDVLAVERIGVHDNFFALGGQSLKAVSLLTRLDEQLHLHIPISTLFQYPTIEELALWIAKEREEPSPVLDTRENQSQPVQHSIAEKHDSFQFSTAQEDILHRRSAQGEKLPVSFSQQRLWFLDQLEYESTAYNLTDAIKLEGRLNEAALSASLAEIVHRHEALRTTFPSHEGQPFQSIAASMPLPVLLLDLQGLPLDKRDGEVQRIVQHEGNAPFNLSKGPLLRVRLLRVASQEHVLLLTLHHIVTDGWSINILTRELATLYQANAMGASHSLPELPVQYADYALWQRHWLQGAQVEAQLAYWRRQLADAPAMLELPTDQPRPPVQTEAGTVLSRIITPALLVQLQELSRREGVTLFMTLLASFQVLLMRYTGQRDILIGTPIANRMRKGLEPLIGFFVNTLVLRTDLSGEPAFKEVLNRVRKTALEAYEHQEVPFEQVVEAVQPERSLHHTPIFQVMFTMQNTPRKTIQMNELILRPVEFKPTSTMFDLTVHVEEAEQQLQIALEYRTDLFAAATIEYMFEHWNVLLESIVSNPEQSIETLPMLTPQEHTHLLATQNAVQSQQFMYCVHQIFEQQVQRTPDAVALIFEEEAISYGALNRLANQLAHHLQKLGVGPETLVGICMARSSEMMVGLLAVLKAGGAYVPLDPAYPSERLHFMLKDTHASVILSQQSLLGCLPEHQAQVVNLDQQWEVIRRQKTENVNSAVHVDNLAYVMYTSGSTGQPKGVGIRHQSILRLVFGMEFVSLQSGQTVLQLAPISFDASTFEIWGALLHGGRCVLYPEEIPTTRDIGTVIATQGVTTLWLTASLFNVIIDEEPEILQSLRYLLTGGEALSVPHVRRALAQLPTTHLINGYGPTESTTFTCCYCIPPSSGADTRSIPLGPPIGNTQVYLLDEHLHMVPLGVVGELSIGGEGLARGYINQPELTAERFVPNPFGCKAGERLYRTGDMARYRTDGILEFHGRRDQQVKIRGFRIELSEIEGVLAQHPAVQTSVVVVREEVPGDKRLVAYIVGTDGESALASVQEHVQANLPSYMVPSLFVPLESLPLTGNGKLDRRALPLQVSNQSDRQATFVAPRTAMEERLALIWAEVLGIERVGVIDNFFALGGHSLLATQLISRIQKNFQVEIALRDLFKAPTVAEMAQIIKQSQDDIFEQVDDDELARMLEAMSDLSD